MGSLTSRPKLPPVTSPMVMAPPVSMAGPVTQTPVSEPQTDTSSPEEGAAGRTAEESNRTAGLLERKRGRLGTVLTGFRGLLSPTGPAGAKRLLGE